MRTDICKVRSYIWGLDLTGSTQGAGGVGGLIAIRTNNIAHFVAYDGNGNVSGLVDGTTRTVSAQYDYDPFGQTLRATGAMAEGNPFRFSTKYTDPESDFIYYGYRYYTPSTGRWLSRDPIEEDGGLNLYGMLGNNPINSWDYLGFNKGEVGFAIDASKLCDKVSRVNHARMALQSLQNHFDKYAIDFDNPDKAKSAKFQNNKWGHHEELVNKCTNLRRFLEALDSVCCLNEQVAGEWAKIRPLLQGALDQCSKLRRPPFADPRVANPNSISDRMLMAIPLSDNAWENIADGALVTSAAAATVASFGAASETLPASLAAIAARRAAARALCCVK